ncbi:MAG: ABC transporter substrate-binding protein [Prevotellaceae bacterium]|nr:ABC transporter substrate-binding protein [Prevotellaceae bacterium]
MKRYLFLLLYAVTVILLLPACKGRNGTVTTTSVGRGLGLRYAANLTLTAYDDYTVATLRNPWDTLHTLHTYILVPADRPLPERLPEGTVLRTPLTRAVVYSSVHCSLLDELGVIQCVAGVCDAKYIKLPFIQKGIKTGRVADCGIGTAPDIERIIDLHPDAILLSPFEKSNGYGRVEKLGVPLVECADYMETSPLGRAEWMRFYGLLFGVTDRADALFARVDSSYHALKTMARQTTGSPTVFSELKNGSVWYVPGGRSVPGRLFADAAGRYAFATDKHSGSVPFSFETVFDKAGACDIWLIKYNRERDMTYADLQAEYNGYTAFNAFKERRIYGCNTSRSYYYEETPFRPDYLLQDLISILHPEAEGAGELRYYSPLKER